MNQRDQDALNNRLRREADNARAAQNARNERARQEQESANRRASDLARRNFNEGQERIRRQNEAREQKIQEGLERDRKRNGQQQQYPQPPWTGSVPFESPSPTGDHGHGPSGHTATKKGGGFGKALLVIIVAICAIGYIGSHSDNSPPTPAPTPVDPTPSPSVLPSETPVQPPAVNTPSSVPETVPAPIEPASQVSSPVVQPGPSDVQLPTPASPPTERVLRVVDQVQPTYPALAKQAGISGTVTVFLEVGSDGSVVDARAERGNPILVKAAIEAARQWRYAPFVNIPGQGPLATTVNFNFGRTE